MNSIPASQFSRITPSVLGAGGNPLSLNTVMLTEDDSIPIGVAKLFPDVQAVQNWFGPNSTEAALAGVYFAGFLGADTVPSGLYFYQYNVADAAAYLRSGSFTGVALAVLQALSGTLIIPIDGRTVTSASINLAGASSFSNAAALIQTGLQTTGGIFTGTGTVTNASPTLTINTTVSGHLHIGDTVVGTDIPAATTIVAFGTYTVLAGTGTVTLSANATGAAGPEAITVSSTATVAYDAQLAAFVVSSPTTGANSNVGFSTGSLATGVRLTAATGAQLSAGAVAATPASAMDGVFNSTQNWVKFMTTFEPALDVKVAFATWVNTTDPAERFAYVAWDSDITPTEGPAPDSFAVVTADFNGVIPIYDATGLIAAFDCGITASTDFTQPNGRVNYAFRSSAAITPNVMDLTTYQNLVANGYNCYAAVATANDNFQWYQRGTISGDWDFEDEYIDQIYLNSQFQLAFVELLANTKRIPYNEQGRALIRGAAIDPINEGLNNGTITAGITLSAQQIQEVNTAAGVKIDTTLSQVGWYLQILDAAPQVRTARGTPPMKFWYTDGGSVQQIDMASINVQ